MGAKRKVTYYIDEDVLQAARVAAARQGIRDSAVVQAALRKYLGFEVIEQARARSEFKDDDEALAFAVAEQHAMRAEKRAQGDH
jgi:hypothetical protein